MNEYAHIADAIKREVKMSDAARYYGLTFNRAGFAVCPFHSEKTPSFKIHNNKGHCFGCGYDNDVIGFTQDLFKLDFLGALRKLNADFGLALPIDRKPTLREQRDAEKRRREILAERAKAEAEQAAYDALYGSLWGKYARLDKQRREYSPQSADDDFNPLYVEAVKNISDIEYRIDVLL